MKVESNNLGVLLKTIWIGLALVTIYCLFMITFTYMLFESLISKQFNIWNLLIPNLISIGIIFIYTKELLIGYNPTSKKKNLKSLIIFYLLIYKS